MQQLKFDDTQKIPTNYSELYNLEPSKIPVVITKDHFIYIAKPSNSRFEEFFTNNVLHDYKSISKIYLFLNSTQIANALEGGTCLDKFLWKPESETHEKQIKKWLTKYKYVGHTWLYKNLRRRTVQKGSCLQSIEPCGGVGAENIVDSKKAGTTGEYQNFIGFDDEYEFFMWLNGKLS